MPCGEYKPKFILGTNTELHDMQSMEGEALLGVQVGPLLIHNKGMMGQKISVQ